MASDLIALQGVTILSAKFGATINRNASGPALNRDRRVKLDQYRGRMEQSAVDHAMVNGLVDACPIGFAQCQRDLDVDFEIVETGRRSGFSRGNTHLDSFAREALFAKISGGVKGGARAQGGVMPSS